MKNCKWCKYYDSYDECFHDKEDDCKSNNNTHFSKITSNILRGMLIVAGIKENIDEKVI
jgi:hypothetical protein